MKIVNKISTCLCFDGNAQEAANFYVSIFKNSKILNTAYYGESVGKAQGVPKESILFVTFKLDGQEFLALNGGPSFKFTGAISLMVACKNQKEIDYFWEKLSKGGDKKAQACGWLKDRFGLSWQIYPSMMIKVFKDKNPEKIDQYMAALMQMKKLDIKTLEKAYRSNKNRQLSHTG